jgi:hypothetical protein
MKVSNPRRSSGENENIRRDGYSHADAAISGPLVIPEFNAVEFIAELMESDPVVDPVFVDESDPPAGDPEFGFRLPLSFSR